MRRLGDARRSGFGAEPRRERALKSRHRCAPFCCTCDAVDYIAVSAEEKDLCFDHGAPVDDVLACRDVFSDFEDALVAEVNLLRRDPSDYAHILSREGTLSYPYMHPDDVFFASDRSASVSLGPSNVCIDLCTGETSESAFEPLCNGYRAELSCSSSVVNNNSKLCFSSASRAGLNACVSETECVILHELSLARSRDDTRTLKTAGMQVMTLSDMRVHLSRHSLYRDSLEVFQWQALSHWKVVREAQREVWSGEDERHTRKLRKSVATRNKSTPKSVQDNVEQRHRATAKVNLFFSNRIKMLQEEVEKEYVLCRRLVRGCNMILDCVRELKACVPVPCLSLSRGLTLATRHAGVSYHGDRRRALRLLDAHRALEDSIHSEFLCKDIDKQRERRKPVEKLPLCSDALPIEEASKTLHLSSAPHIVGICSASRASAEVTEWSHHAGDMCVARTLMRDDGSASDRIASPLLEAQRLAHSVNASCTMFGHLSGELSGAQLYDCHSARSVVINTILGVRLSLFTIGAGVASADSSPSSRACAGVHCYDNAVQSIDHRESFGGVDESGSASVGHRVNGVVRDELSHVACDGANNCDRGMVRGPARGQLSIVRSIASAFMFSGMLARSTEFELDRGTTDLLHILDSHELQAGTAAGEQLNISKTREGLGLLLWSDAHLLGCCWQRITGTKSIPVCSERDDCTHSVSSGDLSSIMNGRARGKYSDDGTVFVNAILTLAISFDDSELIRHRPNIPLTEAHHLVMSDYVEDGGTYVHCDGNDKACCTDSRRRVRGQECNASVRGVDAKHMFHDMSCQPCHVDVHSSFSVKLLSPTTHPVVMPHKACVECILLSVHAQRVQIQACVTPEDQRAPKFVLCNPCEVLVQSSDVDIDVVVVLIDTRAVMRRTGRIRFVVHVYERDRLSGAESGFTHICSVRFALDHASCTSQLSEVTDAFQCGDRNINIRSAADSMLLGGEVHLGRSVVKSTMSARSLTNPSIARCLEPYINMPLKTAPLQHNLSSVSLLHNRPLFGQCENNMTKLSLPYELGRYVAHLNLAHHDCAHSIGWPDTTLHFHERCATLLSPLSPFLTRHDEPVRIAIILPRCKSYLAEQIAALRHTIDQYIADKDMKCGTCAEHHRKSTSNASLLGCSAANNMVLSELAASEDCTYTCSEESRAALLAMMSETDQGKTDLYMDEKAQRTFVFSEEARPGVDVPKICFAMDDTSADAHMTGRAKVSCELSGSSSVYESSARNRNNINSEHSSLLPSVKLKPHSASDIVELDDTSQVDMLIVPRVENISVLCTRASLAQLRVVASKLLHVAAEFRSRFVTADEAMRVQIDILTKDASKAKGREQERLNIEKKAILDKLHKMAQRVVSAERDAKLVAEEAVRREREEVLRTVHIERAQVDLKDLLSRVNRYTPLSVKLWFVSGSVLPSISPTKTPVMLNCRAAPTLNSLTTRKTDSSCDEGVPRAPDGKTLFSSACKLALSDDINLPVSCSNIVTLDPVDEDMTRYEAVFTVPEGFSGQAVLLVEGYECVRWKATLNE